MARIGTIVLTVLLYLWSTTSGAVTTPTGHGRVTSAKDQTTTFEVKPGGHVLRSQSTVSSSPLPSSLPLPLPLQQQHQLLYNQSQPAPTSSLRQREPYHHEQHSQEGQFPLPLSITTQEEEDDTKVDLQCSLYLAPSTIPGAGLGMFSTIDRSVGELVGTEEIIVPLVDFSFYSDNNDKNLFNPFLNYFWRGGERGLHGLIERDHDLHAFVPGLDAAINCNLALLNVDLPNSVYDDGQLRRDMHPMAGAMSPYHSHPSRVTRKIPAGGELFKFYGDNWFLFREDKFGRIPLSDDYRDAQQLLERFEELRQLYFPSNNSSSLRTELWSLIKDTIGTTRWESRIMNALPPTAHDAEVAAKTDIATLHQPFAMHSIDYLRKHGKCADSIRPGPSTLPSQQAGRGAFATRDFAKGSILTGAPLIHVPQKEVLRMGGNYSHVETGDDESWLGNVHGLVGYQAIVNYCFGHAQSTLLLCPYGSGVNYINHNKSLANVKIQWAQNGFSHDSTWLSTRRVEDFEWEYQMGLSFDYVATRDIVEGEELFLDYGKEFEDALNTYMQSWQPPSSASLLDYASAERFNEKVASSPIRTEAKQKQEPYPNNLQIRCHSRLVGRTMRLPHEVDKDEFRWQTRDPGFPCRVLDRYNVSSADTLTETQLYTVELKIPLDDIGNKQKGPVFTYVQKRDVHRQAISFFNKPHTTDLFLPRSFRKEIGIPDHMFPLLWRNI